MMMTNRHFAMMVVLVASSVVGCGRDARRSAAVPDSEKPVKPPPVEVIFTLELGATPQEVISILDEPDADIGSGLLIIEYALRPTGCALIAFGFDNRVANVLVCYSTEADAELPCLKTDGFDEMGQISDARKRQAGPEATKWPPEAFVHLKRGTDAARLIAEIGAPSFRSHRTLEYLLAPQGLATVNVAPDGLVESVDLLWQKGLEGW